MYRSNRNFKFNTPTPGQFYQTCMYIFSASSIAKKPLEELQNNPLLLLSVLPRTYFCRTNNAQEYINSSGGVPGFIKSVIRVWMGGPDSAFPLLFCKNPASHFLFISISRIPCPILANPNSQEQSNPESRSVF